MILLQPTARTIAAAPRFVLSRFSGAQAAVPSLDESKLSAGMIDFCVSTDVQLTQLFSFLAVLGGPARQEPSPQTVRSRYPLHLENLLEENVCLSQ